MPRYLRILLLLQLTSLFVGAETLNGAGATFPYPIYAKWFDAFHERHPDRQIAYAPVGSEQGIQQLMDRRIDFAGSDRPLSEKELAGLSFRVLHFPAVLGAVAPIYNITGVVEDLRFTPETLAGIFLGKIKRWNDPALKAANRHVSLPDREIVVVHRSDGSGTTFVLSEYLSKVSPEWKSKMGVGLSVNWPGGLAAQGNDGVASRVRATPGSIGYVEFIYALQNRLSYGAVRNSSGNFVAAGLDSMAAAARTTNKVPGRPVSLTDSPGREAYPIASYTFLLVPAEFPNPAKAEAMRQFLSWMLDWGQKQAAALGYAPLPEDVAARERSALAELH
jgi:phosphate transport system substrate-binding protein